MDEPIGEDSDAAAVSDQQINLVVPQPAAPDLLPSFSLDPILEVVFRQGPTFIAAINAASTSPPTEAGAAWREAVRLGRELSSAIVDQGLDQDRYDRLVMGLAAPQAQWFADIVFNAIHVERGWLVS